MDQRYENHDGASWGALMIFLFIGLLIIKAMDFEIPWWIVTSPIWVSLVYVTLVDVLNSKKGSWSLAAISPSAATP